MARFVLDDDTLTLTFSRLERFAGLRGNARVPLTDIVSVETVNDVWKRTSGLRVGVGFPRGILLGTMLRRGGNDVVAIYGTKPAVVVALRKGARWQRLIATVPQPTVVTAQIESAVKRASQGSYS